MTYPDHRVSQAQLPPLPEKYRASILTGVSFLLSILIPLGDTLAPGSPIGGVDWWVILFGALQLLGAYFPGSPWAKFFASLAAATGSLVFSSASGGWTPAEITAVAIQFLAATGVGIARNPVKIDDKTGKVVSADRLEPGAIR